MVILVFFLLFMPAVFILQEIRHRNALTLEEQRKIHMQCEDGRKAIDTLFQLASVPVIILVLLCLIGRFV